MGAETSLTETGSSDGTCNARGGLPTGRVTTGGSGAGVSLAFALTSPGGFAGPFLCNLHPGACVCGAVLSPPRPCCDLHLGHDQRIIRSVGDSSYLLRTCVMMSFNNAVHKVRGYTAALHVRAHPSCVPCSCPCGVLHVHRLLVHCMRMVDLNNVRLRTSSPVSMHAPNLH